MLGIYTARGMYLCISVGVSDSTQITPNTQRAVHSSFFILHLYHIVRYTPPA